jgi:hypothetical protein
MLLLLPLGVGVRQQLQERAGGSGGAQGGCICKHKANP